MGVEAVTSEETGGVEAKRAQEGKEGRGSTLEAGVWRVGDNSSHESDMDGLADHSEVVSGRDSGDAENQYYRAMAAIESDYASLLDHLAKVVAQVMYDFCVVHLADESGQQLSVAAVYHSDAEHAEQLEASLGDRPCSGREGLLGAVYGSGKALLRPEWSAGEADRQPCLSWLWDAQDVEVHSLIVVPLTTPQGHTLGTMLMGRHATTAPYSETDLALARSIASHAAMKAETARLTNDLYRANEQLEEAVQMRDMFISIASHELRTPLGAMQLLVELLRREATMGGGAGVAAERILERLEGIDRQVGRMSKLVDRLLDVSRLSEGRVSLELQRVDLVEIIERVVERQQEEAEDADIHLRIEADRPVIGHWDPDRIDQVVTNLVSNAIKYGDGNPVEIGVRDVEHTTEFWVRDRGVGIEPGDQERIFERFERTDSGVRKGGLGLGLWIVREIVHAFDGTIDVSSDPGEGTTFRVSLPKGV